MILDRLVNPLLQFHKAVHARNSQPEPPIQAPIDPAFQALPVDYGTTTQSRIDRATARLEAVRNGAPSDAELFDRPPHSITMELSDAVYQELAEDAAHGGYPNVRDYVIMRFTIAINPTKKIL